MNVPNNVVSDPAAAPEDTGAPSRDPAVIRRRIVVNVLRVLLLVAIVGGWEVLARLGVIDKFFWGEPSGIWAQIVTWVTDGTAQGPLWQQIAVTLEEAVIGFLIGVALGVVLGVVLGRNRFLADLLSPYIKAANSIPRVTLAPLFAIALGLGLQSKVALAAVLVFFIVFFNAFQGVREVDRNLLANARILGANNRQLSTQVIIPSALSWILASLHVSFSFALVGAVVGEFIGGIQGLGLMVASAGANFNTNGVFAAMVILAAVALTAEAFVTWLENRLVRWRPNVGADTSLTL
jgi:NitT/TauT family transport system permease protein